MDEIIGGIIGIIFGIFSGLIPGVHANTISSILVQLNLDPVFLSFIIIGAIGTHTILSFLPAIFLGIPDDQTVKIGRAHV